MFKFMYDISGFNHALTMDMPIDKATDIRKGQLVRVTSGKIVCRQGGPYLGVANETHTGEHDPFNPRNDGELINVIVSTRAVYSSAAPFFEFPHDAINETTVLSPIAANYNAMDFVGGYIAFLSKGPSSENTDKLGDIREITAYSTSSRELTLSSGGKIGTGDKYVFFPPVGMRKLEMDSTCSRMILSDLMGDFTVLNYDFNNLQLHVICRNNLIT